jgi:membrane carboxypeptidase/penicillin-binding protein PbpC
MARSVSKTFVLAVGVILSAMLFAGCEEEEKISDTNLDATPGVKQSRLIAVENLQLKRQIEQMKIQYTSEMQRQKELNDKERQRLQRQLDNCLRAQAASEEISKKGVESYMQDIIGPLSDENAKLQEENKTFKAQIEKLKSELEEARN